MRDLGDHPAKRTIVMDMARGATREPRMTTRSGIHLGAGKRNACTLAFVAGFRFIMVSGVHAQSTEAVVAKARDAVVVIEVFDQLGRPLSQGSGFAVGTEPWIVTNLHVVAGGHSASVTTRAGRTYRVNGFVAVDQEADLAVLSVNQIGVGGLELGKSDVVPGADAVVIGAPLGFTQTVTTGAVSGVVTQDGVDRIQFSALVSPGSSGSPLLDAQGMVIGVVTTRHQEAPQINYAVASSVIIALLEAVGPVLELTPFRGHAPFGEKGVHDAISISPGVSPADGRVGAGGPESEGPGPGV